MNREIKFRLWHKKTKEMIILDKPWMCDEYSSLAFRSTKEEYEGIGRLPSYPTDDIEQYEIMQYTGLKDKNGVEIYEGDVVCNETKTLGRFSKGNEGEVYFNKKLSHYAIWLGYPEKHSSYDNLILTEAHAKHLTIISNIHGVSND